MTDNRFSIDYAKRQAGCKKCKQKIEKGEVRIAKITASPFSDDGEMKNYHHPACMFDTFKKARATTKIIEDPSDLEGWSDLKQDDKEPILQLIRETERVSPKKAATPKKGGAGTPKQATKKAANGKANAPATEEAEDESASSSTLMRAPVNPDHKDNSFREFRRLCASIADTPGYLDKSALVEKWFSKGTDQVKFQGDLHVWVRLLLPGVIKRVYNMQSKQMVKVFSRIFETSEEEMIEDLEQGDVAETIGKFYECSNTLKPPKKSDLSVHHVDKFLDELSKLTKEEEQQYLLKKVTMKCTLNDLKMFIRVMKGDLRIQAGSKHILDGVHNDAYESFNTTRNIVAVIDKVLEVKAGSNPKASLSLGASLMQPVQPMLAQACKSIEMAFQKCPNGMYSEIKYDGERVQLHKKGKEFKYFSRSLKPVMAHKVKHFAEHIPKAFPDGSDLILDAEVLMVDNKTGKPLPFGTLGVHKGSGFKDATPCLFVFDCMYYNGENFMNKPVKERRKLLEKHMVEVGNNVKFSELVHVTKKSQLAGMIKSVLDQGLEGLVLKDVMGTYEPGKRHWLKVKKDYLNEGAMADTADLVVLGGWFGTGQKGGLMSSFLLGCYDHVADKWCTVTKCAMGFDDATLDRLQGELLPLFEKIKGDYDMVPGWFKINRQMVPDFLAKDPKKCPVWEITGAEFSKAELHTAAGISIRFPRMTKMRKDKNWKTATSLKELQHLYTESKNNIDINISGGTDDENDVDDSKNNNTPKKRKQNTPKASPVKKIKAEPEQFSPVKIKSEGFEYDKDDDYMMSGEDANPPATKNLSAKSGEIRTLSGFLLKEVQGDLFSSPNTESLCHCISRDLKLGKGIAKLFREKFGRIEELKKSDSQIGGIAVLKDRERYIYNLVTKEKYSEEPTYESLRKSLEEMKIHALAHGVEHISMPMIGCGLDGLSWPAVRTLVKNVFQLEKIKITVYHFGQAGGTTVKTEPGTFKKESRTISEMFKKESKQSIKREYDDKPIIKSPKKSNEQPSISKHFEAKVKKQSKVTDLGFGYSTTKPLSDVFLNVKVHLKPGVTNAPVIERHLVAYGGVVQPDFRLSEATHIVYPEGARLVNTSGDGVKHVAEQWLVDSIKLKNIQDERLYKIK
eukprot:TRINITY_DN10792_c0_g1_i1.p1 TRINITY_DN10792_c0_g1~~TRINITY_DN10792_c0_g1_i1.p1  ORF type:complete len:1194 (-),score=363.16 TRINITY_DN10792_c0_g1_i1:78-3470(-)